MKKYLLITSFVLSLVTLENLYSKITFDDTARETRREKFQREQVQTLLNDFVEKKSENPFSKIRVMEATVESTLPLDLSLFDRKALFSVSYNHSLLYHVMYDYDPLIAAA